jgi:xanthine dehydrogenase accessory factor
VSLFESLAELERGGGRGALATVIRVRGSVPRHVSAKMLVYPSGRIEGTVGGGEMERRVIAEALEVIARGEARIIRYTLSDPKEGDPGVCGGEVEVFVEPIRARPTLVVIGGGHVGKAVAHLAHWLGFRVAVSDDRPEFARAEAAPEADLYLACPLSDLPKRMTIDDQTYLVLTTRGVQIDVDGLPALLETPAAYIGVIGSRRRWEMCAQQLRELGVPEEKIGRITSPMGLELNAETPEEIAVSILAEIIQLRRGGTGKSMRHRPHKAPGSEG